MARTQLTVTPVSHYQLTPEQTAVPIDIVNGMWMYNDGATYIHFKSTSGSPQTVTILLPAGTDLNLTTGPRVYSFLANETANVGFWPAWKYGTPLLLTASSALITAVAYSFA